MLPKVIGGKSVERNSFWLERYYFNPLLDEVDTPKFKAARTTHGMLLCISQLKLQLPGTHERNLTLAAC